MKPLYSESEFLNALSQDKLPCQCYKCNNIFYMTKHGIQKVLNVNTRAKGMYCSNNCRNLSKIKKEKVFCSNCNGEFEKFPSEISKNKNNFCSRSCAAKYNNTHKTKGNRRSKLEKYLENQLNLLYPDFEILFNNKNIINSELDIYIPKFKLAFELNGIFHYEPIYGQEKLIQIRDNDNRKFQACLEHGIELCIIDTSQQKYFKEQTAIKYLNIIISVLGGSRTRTSYDNSF